MTYDEKLHADLLRIGRTLEKGITHKLEPEMLNPVFGTLEYYNVRDAFLQQSIWDLKVAKYKIWDWLGMMYTGEYEPHEHKIIEKMVKLYVLQENVGGWAQWLMGHDLDIEEPKHCKDCIKKYNYWHKQTPEQREQDQKELENFYGGTIDIS